MSLRLRAAGAVLLVTAGCTSGDGQPPAPLPGSGDVAPVADYPDPPYGVIKGARIQNYDFEGFVDASQDSSDDGIVPILLNDFFNPTGDGTYSADSSLPEGEPKPRLLFLNLSAVWCGPCQEEVQEVFPIRHPELKPLGAEFLLVLTESVNMGEPASVADLQNWTAQVDDDLPPVSYPSVLDPERHLANVFDSNAYPGNMLIDTETMTIIEQVVGIPGDSFWDLARSKLEE